MIQIPGTQPADPTLAPPPDLPVDSTSSPATGEPDVMPDGTNAADLPESVQVAGVAGALRGLLGKVFRKSDKEVTKVVPPSTPPAAATGGATPPPVAPKPPAAATPPEPKPAAPKPKTPEELDAEALKTVPGFKLPDAKKAEGIASEMTSGAPRTIDPERTTVRNFRSDKLNTTDDIKALIDNVAEESGGFQKARRGTVSNAQTAEEAKDYGLEDLLRRKPAESWNAAQLSAGREILLELSDRITKAARIVDAGKASPEDMLAFRRLIANHAAVQETLQGAVAEAGRALQIMRTVSASGGRLRTKQILETLDSLGGPGATQTLAQAVLDAGGDAAKIAKLTKKGWAEKTADVFNEIRINGMLSGPKTHAVNTASNALAALLQVPERSVASLIGKTHVGPKVQVGEDLQMLYGMLSGWEDTFRLVSKVWRTGEPTDAVSKLENRSRAAITSSNFGLDETSMAGKAADLIGEIIRLPGRAMMTTDELFKARAYRSEVAAQAARRASEEGLEGAAYQKRVAELKADPPDDIKLAGDKASKYLTFQDSLGGPGLLNALGRGGMQISEHPLGKIVLPFIRTPINVAQFTLERTPMAPLTARFREAIAKGGPEGDLALARFSLGSVAAALVAARAETGQITGGGPSDPRLRRAMEESGWRPYSILVDGTYVSYNRLDPLGAAMGATADAVDVLKYADDEETAGAVTSAVVTGFANSMASKTYVQGLSDLLEVMGDPDNEKRISSYAARQAQTFMPYGSLINFFEQASNSQMSDPQAGDPLTLTLNMLKSRIPGLSADVPPKLDIWGEPIDPGPGVLSPISWSKGKTGDLATQEVVEYAAAPEKPSAQIVVKIADGPKPLSARVDLLKLDPEGWLYSEFKQLVGRKARERIDALVETAGYQSLPQVRGAERTKALQDEFKKAREDAIAELLDNRPQVMRAAEDEINNPRTRQTVPLPAHMLETTP